MYYYYICMTGMKTNIHVSINRQAPFERLLCVTSTSLIYYLYVSDSILFFPTVFLLFPAPLSTTPTACIVNLAIQSDNLSSC